MVDRQGHHRDAHRLAKRSETQFDDKLVALLHRPIFTTVALIGLILATYEIGYRRGCRADHGASRAHILVFVWIVFGFRFIKLLLGTMRGHPDQFGMVQPSTEPLLSNFIAVVFFIGGAYAS